VLKSETLLVLELVIDTVLVIPVGKVVADAEKVVNIVFVLNADDDFVDNFVKELVLLALDVLVLLLLDVSVLDNLVVIDGLILLLELTDTVDVLDLLGDDV